jgi:hypothetical protein
LKRLMEINPTYCLTIEIVPFRNSDLLVAYGSLIREVRQAARLFVNALIAFLIRSPLSGATILRLVTVLPYGWQSPA